MGGVDDEGGSFFFQEKGGREKGGKGKELRVSLICASEQVPAKKRCLLRCLGYFEFLGGVLT